jgi:hypothetical protein
MVDVADEPDDRPRHTTTYERFSAGRPDYLNDRVNVRLGRFGGHHDHHLVLLAFHNDESPRPFRPGAWSFMPFVRLRSA